MRIVITGTSGLVGADLWRELLDQHELWGVGRRKPEFVPIARWRSLDIVDAANVQSVITHINADCVIHCAALSTPDDCERDPETAFKANALGTRNLALACQRFDTELVFVSTDQVFSGSKKSPYTELDPTDPGNVYGRSKVYAEECVKQLLRRFYIVRTSLVFGPGRATFVDKIMDALLGKNDSVTACTDLINSPTYSIDLARAIRTLIESHLYGTYHIANSGYASRWEMAEFIANSLELDVRKVHKGEAKDVAFVAKRPGYTPIENWMWNMSGFPPIRSWQEALIEHLTEKMH